jgi:predicted MFS family arabinose efflux permease
VKHSPTVGALRERNFRLLFIGQSVSALGNALVPVALAFAVLDLTHSPADLGYVLGAEAVAQVVFLLAGGVIADRLSRRSVMLGADSVRGVAEAALGALLITGRPSVWLIAALAAVQGMAGAVFTPASTGLTPAVVSNANLQQANQIQQVALSGAAVAGPALAGLLVVAADPGWAILADAVSFGVSVVFLASLDLATVPRASRQRFITDLREGWDEFRSRTWLWTITVVSAVFNFLYAAYIVLGPVVSQRSYGGAAAWATVATVGGIGSVVGGLLCLRLRPRHPLRWAVSMSCPLALPPMAFAAGLPVPAIAAAAALGGTGIIVFYTLFTTTFQRQVPEQALSRVSSYDWFASLAVYPVGLAVAGPVAVVLGVRPVLWGTGLIELAAILSLLLVPSIRQLTNEVPAGTRPQTPPPAPDAPAPDPPAPPTAPDAPAPPPAPDAPAPPASI